MRYPNLAWRFASNLTSRNCSSLNVLQRTSDMAQHLQVVVVQTNLGEIFQPLKMPVGSSKMLEEPNYFVSFTRESTWAIREVH